MTAKTTRKYFSVTILTTFSVALITVVIAACTNESAKAKPNIVHKSSSNPNAVAKIGDVEVSMEELVGDSKLAFYDLEKKIYELKMEQLEKLMIEKLIGAQAKKAGMTQDQYIEKKITKGAKNVSNKEVDAFAKEKRIPRAQLNDNLKERIKDYLRQQKGNDLIKAHIAKLTKNNPVVVYFEKPRLNLNVEVGTAPSWGKDTAKVKIVEFSDFECPFCGRAVETLAKIKKNYKGKVQIAFKQFPLPMHRNAVPAHEAGLCINEQGSSKFWKYHDIVFKNQDKLDSASLEKYAKQSGADVKKFKECFESKRFAAEVQKDLAYGEKLGVRSTPTFFVNGQLISGAVPYEQFAAAIDDELKMSKN